MSFTTMLSDVREARTTRRSERERRSSLARELAVYNTPAERRELELLAQSTGGPGAEEVLEILNTLPMRDSRTAA